MGCKHEHFWTGWFEFAVMGQRGASIGGREGLHKRCFRLAGNEFRPPCPVVKMGRRFLRNFPGTAVPGR